MTDFNSFFNTQDDTPLFDPADISKNSGVSAIAYIWILFFVPLVSDKASRFGRFHANQGLVLLLANVALWIVDGIISAIVGWIPILGGVIVGLLSFAVGVVTFGLMILGIINAINGKAKQLPLIGKIKLIQI